MNRNLLSTRGRAAGSWLSDARIEIGTFVAFVVAVAGSVVVVLGGCASPAGIAHHAHTVAAESVGIERTAISIAVPSDWWKRFDDPALDRLVERALAGSPTLKVVEARIERAAASVAGARAASGPQANGQFDVNRERFSANSIYPPPLGGSSRTLASAQINGSWELDFFGRNRAAIEAALGAGRAAQADKEAARVVLASTVAHNYFQLGRLLEQRAVAARTLQQRDEILSLIRQRVQGGIDTAVELRQGEGALPETRQLIEQLDEQIALTRHALAALTAQAPAALDALTVKLSGVQALPAPRAVPADLLGRRADVAAARWRIEAAAGDMASARAQFYPNVNLAAFAGLASIGLSQLINAGSEQFGIGPALRLPIFDGGRLRANLRGKAAEVDAAIESYNGAVIDAVHDVADQIASLSSIGRQQREQARAQEAAESAYDLATQRFRAGLGTYLTVLNAEATVLNQRRQATDLKARALDMQVALIRALGGGYTQDQPLLATSASTH